MISLAPLGDRAFLAKFAAEDDAAQWVRTVRARAWPGVVDVVLAYRTAAVFADPEQLDLDDLEARLRRVVSDDEPHASGTLLRIPVLYDGDDLPDAARRLGLTEAQVIAEHTGPEYRVFAIGFLPGFPYAGYLPPTLSGLARRESPRVRVSSGSVAIVGRQTGIYPAESPGGWYLIGRTPLRIVDLDQGFFPIRAGDRLRFEPIDLTGYQDRLGERLSRPE
jgi:KipI family sensor histidine kinase inhibitor